MNNIVRLNEMKTNRLLKGIGLVVIAMAVCSCHGRRSSISIPIRRLRAVISISADESFRDIIQQEIDVFESIYIQAGILPIFTDEVDAIDLLLKDSVVRLAITSR